MIAGILARSAKRRRAAQNQRPSCEALDLLSLDYTLIDGVKFETAYLRIPDVETVADDIVLEARNDETEVALTREYVDGAEHLGIQSTDARTYLTWKKRQ